MVRWKFSDKFRSHWIKVKFYKEKPETKDAKRLKNIRFCQATKEAVKYPIILDKDSISCFGAQYAFGWSSNRKKLLETCMGKIQAPMASLKSAISQNPRIKNPFKYIGLNTEGVPDLIMSYTAPQEIMNLTRIYQEYEGKNLDISLYYIMAICGGIVAKTYLEKKITLSFGCVDSRNFADLGRHAVAVGVPKSLCNMFVD